jgi:hypothetical protein
VYGHNTGKLVFMFDQDYVFVMLLLGIIYNNQMDDFSQPGSPNYYGYAPSPANFIKPCKLSIVE